MVHVLEWSILDLVQVVVFCHCTRYAHGIEGAKAFPNLLVLVVFLAWVLCYKLAIVWMMIQGLERECLPPCIVVPIADDCVPSDFFE